LAELDGAMGDAKLNAHVRQGLQKCVAKIEKNQLKDGSWNIAGGWAPILGTSMASQSLFKAQQKGVAVSPIAMNRMQQFTKLQDPPTVVGIGAGTGSGGAGGTVGSVAMPMRSASAGVSLYQEAQVLEQLSRTPADREKNAAKIRSVTAELSNKQFLAGFGSIGGEEFFSYLNISDS